MIGWFKSLFGSGPVTININKVVACDCCRHCDPKPQRPKAPVIGAGESVLMIKFPVTVAAGSDADIDKTVLTYSEDGLTATVLEVAGNGGSFDIIVADGSSGDVFSHYVDKAGNASPASPTARFENASDTTPPAAPAGAPVIGAGQTV